MLRIYYGPDTYSRTQAVAELKAELDTDGMLSANTVTFDGNHLDIPALLATCDTVPFLAAHRLVVVAELIAQAQSRAGRGRARRAPAAGQPGTVFDPLIEYIPRMPPTTTLLLLDGIIGEQNGLLNALRPMAEVRQFPLMGEQQLIAWVAERSQALGTAFEPRAAALLVRSVHGADLWTLAGEVEKLSLYAAGRTLTESDVTLLVPATQDSNVFAMVDAIVAGRLDAALRQLRLLLQEGAAGPYLITMIARQFRQLIIAEDLGAAGAGMSSIAQATEIRSDAPLRRVIQNARRLGPARLQLAFEQILDADLSIKRGELDEAVALELLVSGLANVVGTRSS